MAKAHVFQTNFSSGELDPLMAARKDTGAYQNGARRLRNMALLATGGATRRLATRRLYDLGATPRRVIPFDYDELNRYEICLYDQALTVHSYPSGALVQTITGAPWLEAELFEITFSQVADTLILAHKNWPPQLVRRLTSTTFSRAVFGFETSADGKLTYQPYNTFADPTIRLTPSGIAGSITITASASLFTADWVGARIRMFGVECLITAYTSATQVTATVQGTIDGQLIPNPFRALVGTTTVEVTHIQHGLASGSTITFSGANDIVTADYTGAGAVGYTTIKASELNGAKTITVIDDNTYSITVTSVSRATVDGGGPRVRFSTAGLATLNWDEAVFSKVRGYPRAVCFHEQRLWFGGTDARPDGLWSSGINRVFNFNVGESLDNESIQVSIGVGELSAIKHIASNKHLQVFTGTAEFYTPRSYSQPALTPGNFNIVRQASNGVANVRPMPFDGATIYVQSNGKTVREFNYSETEAAYNSIALSILSSHLIRQPYDVAASSGTSKRPEQYAVFVNTDGTLAVFHSARAEKLAGWTLWECGEATDIFTSVASIGDRIFAVVKRGTRYLLEIFEEDDELPLDCATDYSGPAATVWSVNTIYRGRTVAVVSGDFYLGSFVVSNTDTVTLNDSVTSITVGYDFETETETLPPSIDAPDGSTMGEPSRISTCWLWLHSTMNVTLAGQTLILRLGSDNIEDAPERATGVYRFHMSGYSRQPTVRITQSAPLPMRILGLKTRVVV